MNGWNRKATIGGLLITRKEGQKMTINYGELVIEVVQIKGKTVRLAFNASKEISIQRLEVAKTPEQRSEQLSFFDKD